MEGLVICNGTLAIKDREWSIWSVSANCFKSYICCEVDSLEDSKLDVTLSQKVAECLQQRVSCSNENL